MKRRSAEYIAELVHGCTPAEALIDVIEDIIGVGFFNGFVILVNSISQALGSTSGLTSNGRTRLMRLRMLVVTVGTVVLPQLVPWRPGVMSLLRSGSFPLPEAYIVVVRMVPEWLLSTGLRCC